MYNLKRKLKLSDDHKKRIYNKVLSLPSRERLAILSYFWEQKSHFQISRHLSVPVHTIPGLIQSAMNRLRAELLEIAEIYFETYPLINNYKRWRN